MSTTRCAGCGSPITPGDPSVEIKTGNYQKAGPKPLTESARWGLMHKSCFNRSIDSPEAALEEIRRMAEEVNE